MKVFAAKFILIFGFIALLSFVFKFPADQAIASCVKFNARININYYPKDASGNQKNVFAGCNGDSGDAGCTGEIKEFSGGNASLTKCSCYEYIDNPGCLQLLMSSSTPSMVSHPGNSNWHDVPSGLTPQDSGCSVSCTGNCACYSNGPTVYTPTYTITCPVNGACGTGHWNCSAGDGVDPTSESGNPTDGYSWVCKGSHGGSPSGTCTEGPSCSGNPDAPTVTPPTENVCPPNAPTGISWNDTAGPGGHYSIRIRDNANNPPDGWEDSPPDCKNDVKDNSNGNACSDSVYGLSFSHTFHTGHAYSIWMYAINACGHWSPQGGAWYNVITPINGGLGSCPACGGGTKSCNNPAPNECGLTCQQQGLDSSCNTPPCTPTGLSASSACILPDGHVGVANMTFNWGDAAGATSYYIHWHNSDGWHQVTAAGSANSITETVDDNYNVEWYVTAHNNIDDTDSSHVFTQSKTCGPAILTVNINPEIGSATGADSVTLHSSTDSLGSCGQNPSFSGATSTKNCTGEPIGNGSTAITPQSVTPACIFQNFSNCSITKDDHANTGASNANLNCSTNPQQAAGIYLSYNDTATVTANYDCHYKVKVHVFVDFNGDKVQNKVGDPAVPGYPKYDGTMNEPDYTTLDYSPSNNTISWSGAISGHHAPGPGGNYEITSIPPGVDNETVRIEVPTGWTLTTPPQQSVQFGGPVDLEGFVNFGIQPTAPTCTITAATEPETTNPITVSTQPPHNTATLTTVATKPTTYKGNLTYTWAPAGDVLGSITSTNPVTTASTTVNDTIWTAPSDIWDSDLTARPTATVCQTGASSELCNNCQVGVGTPPIVVKPFYSISGFVYVDANKDTKPDDGESNYTIPPYPTPDLSDPLTKALKVSICPKDSSNTSTQFCSPDPSDITKAIPVDPTTGKFTTGVDNPVLLSGEYTVKLMTLPDPSWSYSGGQNSYQITVHKPCPIPDPITDPIEPSGTCDPDKGNVSGVAFGINNLYTWIQTTGGDVYMKEGINYHVSKDVPDGCGGATDPNKGYMSIDNGSTLPMPGIMFTGNEIANFDPGDASFKQWIVGKGSTYVNIITPPGTTAYGTIEPYITDTLKLHITTAASCTTPCALDTTNPGVHEIGSASDKITIADTTFTADHPGDFTFLIPGSLDITGNIKVPIGVVATFIVQGDITVESSVGQDPNASSGTNSYLSSATNLDGYFSTDKNFTILGTNNCGSGKDRRLNMSGAIVVNATANPNNPSGTGGKFTLQRDMCEHDKCPTFSIQARPDFVINAPPYLQATNRIWQEVAP